MWVFSHEKLDHNPATIAGERAIVFGGVPMCFRKLAAALVAAAFAVSPALADEPWPVLIGPAEAQARYATPGLRIVDLRPRADYARGHADGAVSAPMERWKAAGAGGLPEVIGDAGIHPERPILLVHEDTGPERLTDLGWLVWELKQRGVPSVSVLKGGMAAWRASGLRMTGRVHRHSRYRLPFARSAEGELPEFEDMRLGLTDAALLQVRLDASDSAPAVSGIASMALTDLVGDEGLADPVGMLDRIKNASLPLAANPIVVFGGSAQAGPAFWFLAGEILGIEGVVVLTDPPEETDLALSD